MSWRKPVDFRQPSRGPRYTRCPICNAQVTARVGPRATTTQIQFDLNVALARHKRDRHSETKDDDD